VWLTKGNSGGKQRGKKGNRPGPKKGTANGRVRRVDASLGLDGQRAGLKKVGKG